MPESDIDPAFEELLRHLASSRGFDFTGYKRASLKRRIDKRMRTAAIDEYDQYVDFLETHPHEFAALFNTILINVTAFFRDTSTWTYLRDEVLPRQFEGLDPSAPIRMWSAGCASGEEAFSLAIVAAEVLGLAQSRERVKVYGTDIDEEALQTAQQATYNDRELAGLPAALRAKYFEDGGGRYSFRADLRPSVIFGRLDMLHDAPISRLDVLACRNTLMYLNAETQDHVLNRFHFALNPGGILLLGKAETLLSQSALFEPIDRRRRVFRKVPATLSAMREPDRQPPGARTLRAVADSLAAAAVEASPVPMAVVDRDGFLVYANHQARGLFSLSVRDHGRPFQDLELSYRPVELRTQIEQAYESRGVVLIRAAEWFARGKRHVLDVEVTALDVGGEVSGALIVFIDRTQQRQLEDQLRQSNDDLEHAYVEVQSTNEELETTNEELQSMIEELETTNEELQSTNAELETMNEELQSTNDEFHRVNEEVPVRDDEVDELTGS